MKTIKLFLTLAIIAFTTSQASAQPGYDPNTSDNSGLFASAFGGNTTAIGSRSLAAGYWVYASGHYSFAMGTRAVAKNTHAMAFGVDVQASNNRSMIFGTGVGNGTSNKMINNIPNSLMVGFKSNIPTLFVGSSSGLGTTGNVGIGTTTPNAGLHVKNLKGNGTVIIQGKQDINIGNSAEIVFSTEYEDGNVLSGDQTGRKTLIRSTANGYWGTDARLGFFTSSSNSLYPEERMTISPNGNVGIGTSTPSSKLHVTNGSLTLDGTAPNWNTWKTRIATPMGSAWVTSNSISSSYPNTGKYLGFGMTNSGWYWGISPNSSGTSSTNIKHALSLSTNGLLKARSIQVTLSGWADYVFAEDYKLAPLAEVEEYIMENNHLPGVPSEKEVLKEGINLGDMNVVLLKKIEELTLYMIALKKDNQELRDLIENK